jgi:hypothetical protein
MILLKWLIFVAFSGRIIADRQNDMKVPAVPEVLA